MIQPNRPPTLAPELAELIGTGAFRQAVANTATYGSADDRLAYFTVHRTRSGLTLTPPQKTEYTYPARPTIRGCMDGVNLAHNPWGRNLGQNPLMFVHSHPARIARETACGEPNLPTVDDVAAHLRANAAPHADEVITGVVRLIVRGGNPRCHSVAMSLITGPDRNTNEIPDLQQLNALASSPNEETTIEGRARLLGVLPLYGLTLREFVVPA